ncbi:BRO1 domain-containing protein, partial [Blastocladiella britannica]
VTTNCIQYEKACVLFNVAAVHSQLAANQQIWTRDGIKVAAQHFQRAAGVFSHIRDTLVPRFRIQLEKTSDLHPATVHALVEVMLAQAHECFVEKANI